MANWLSNFLVSLTFLSLLDRLGSVSTFLLYAVLSLAGLWFCCRFVPETKGVPLERIEIDLRAGRPLRRAHCRLEGFVFNAPAFSSPLIDIVSDEELPSA